MNQPEVSPPSEVLSRELSAFLIQFSVALHKTAAYPGEHPVVKDAIELVYRLLLALQSERKLVAIGVARNQLIVDNMATDPRNPVLEELANFLHRHQIGALRFQSGTTLSEMTDLLLTLSLTADRAEVPFGLRPREEIDRWQYIKVIPHTFEGLGLADGSGEGEGTTRHTELWLGLASTALAQDIEAEPGATDTAPDPERIAQAIAKHRGDSTYDKAIDDYLLKAGNELRLQQGAGARALSKQINGLLESLDQSTLSRLLQVGGGLAERTELLTDLSATLPVHAVMDLIRAAADTGEQKISHAFLRMLSKLADHADPGEGNAPQPHANEHFRESIKDLLDDWTLDDPNPDKYTGVLDRLATIGKSETATDVIETAGEAPRIIQMAIEIDVFGATVKNAVNNMLQTGRYRGLLEILDAAPESSNGSENIWNYLSSPDQLKYLLTNEEHDLEGLQRVLERLGPEAAEILLDALATAGSRAMRYRLLSILTGIGSTVGPIAAERLPEAEWYVKRNILILVGSLPEWPEGFSPERYTRDNDARVRREAVKLMLQGDGMDRAILIGILDSDATIVRMALTAAALKCPMEAEPQVLELLGNEDRDIRVLAIRTLNNFSTSRVLETLLRYTLAKRKWWQRRPRLSSASPEMLAALAALAKLNPDSQDGLRVLEMAGRDSRLEVRNVVNAV
jgi:hypothetical protein